MRVYRIEHKSTGLGPFSSGLLQSTLEETYGPHYKFRRYSVSPYEMPNPYNDSDEITDRHSRNNMLGEQRQRSARFGFRLIGHMRRWFKPALLRALSARGFVLAVYETEDVAVGRAQVLFDRRTATLVEYRDLCRNETLAEA